MTTTSDTKTVDLTQFEALLGDPANAPEAELNDLHDRLDARARELQPKVADKTLDDTEMAELRDIIPALRTTTAQRAEWAQARDSAYGEFGEFFNEVDAANTESDTEQGESEAASSDEGGEDASDQNADTGQPAMAASGTDKPKRTPTTTTPRVPEIGTTAQHAPKPPNTSDGNRVPIAVTASADVYGFSAGANMGFDNVGHAMTNKLEALRTSNQLHTGHGELVPVATLRASGVPDERKLSRHDWQSNNRKMDAVANERAIVAAGGLCAPLAIDYSYQTVGTTGRPVRDSLPTFQAERGGIMFRPDVSPITDTTTDGPRSATGVWTNENDEDADLPADPGATPPYSPPRKAVWIVDCPDVITAEVEALTLQLEFSNVTSRFDPETVQANQAAALIHHDRFAENHLMAKLRNGSKALTHPAAVLGATRDLLSTLDKMSAYSRNVHRLSDRIPMRAIMPAWTKNLLRADMAKAMSVADLSNLNISDGQLDSWLANRGLSPVWHLDGTDDALSTPTMARQSYALATANTAVPDFPSQVEILMHPEGHFTFLDGGTLDLGVVRDSDLIDRNRYRQFTESWEGVAARGPEALRLVATIDDNGRSAGTV